VFLYIGVQLVIHSEDWEITEKTFKDLGFERVYRPFVLPGSVIEDLKKDIASKSAHRKGETG